MIWRRHVAEPHLSVSRVSPSPLLCCRDVEATNAGLAHARQFFSIDAFQVNGRSVSLRWAVALAVSSSNTRNFLPLPGMSAKTKPLIRLPRGERTSAANSNTMPPRRCYRSNTAIFTSGFYKYLPAIWKIFRATVRRVAITSRFYEFCRGRAGCRSISFISELCVTTAVDCRRAAAAAKPSSEQLLVCRHHGGRCVMPS